MRIIGLAPNEWHGQWVNRQQLLSRLGLRHQVLYSTGAWSVWERNTAEWRNAKARGAAQHADNVLVEMAPKYLLRWPRWPRFDQFIIRAHARRLRRLVGPEGTPLLAAIFHPTYFPYLHHLRPDLVAYHAYDLFEATPGWTAELEALEVALLRRADIVTAVSESIATRLREKVPREIKLLPNGVDLEAFDAAGRTEASVPADLARISRPRLGWVGSLHPHVDFGLVAQLARARPDWSFVFVGASLRVKDDRAERELELCRACPNVHFLGEKHRSEVPEYVANMDVNLMLYRLSEETWIKASHPLKLHEYLAVGKPAVSSDIPSVREFEGVVRIAAGPRDWLQAIEDALASGGTGTQAERRAVAAQNSWDSRTASLDRLFAQLVEDRRGGGRSKDGLHAAINPGAR